MIRQIWHGCGELPYVGPHPGTIWVIVFLFLGLMAGGLGGLLIMAAFILPPYFIGAYERAQLSDRRARRRWR